MIDEIRRAAEPDIGGILNLLSQVLEVHAAIRPDLFITGKTKYTHDELREIIKDDDRPIYVAIGMSDEADDKGQCDEVDGAKREQVLGYAFCMIENVEPTNCSTGRKELYLDDLCGDESVRGTDVATRIFEHVKSESVRLGCDYITLNVWDGNIAAQKFYEKMGMKPRKTMMEIRV